MGVAPNSILPLTLTHSIDLSFGFGCWVLVGLHTSYTYVHNSYYLYMHFLNGQTHSNIIYIYKEPHIKS